jgi:hypothetical protein
MFYLWLQTNIKGVYYEYFEFLQRLYKVYSCSLRASYCVVSFQILLTKCLDFVEALLVAALRKYTP